jgi:acetate kinase
LNVLVINCGSSSLKVDVLDPDSGARSLTAKAERLGTPQATVCIGDAAAVSVPGADHAVVLAQILPSIEGDIVAVGHRVVHGGERFNKPVRIDDAVEATIAELVPLAPLHNPANLAGIRAARAALPDAVHVAVFDTAFHQTLPSRAKTYALPLDLQKKHGIRRFGFHGPSHQWVARLAGAHMDADLQDLRVITCHLGNGASVTAVEYGRSVETSMGMTPLEGLVMGTRAGDVDAGVVLELMRREGLDVEGMDALLNKHSGLAGLSGVGNDLRDIEARASEGDEACRLAIHVFCHRLRKYIGAYAAVMGGVDAIVFTAGIGENSALIRHRVAQRLDFLGARLDEDLNRDAQVDDDAPVAEISSRNSRVRLLVARTDEAHAIATDTADLTRHKDAVADPGTVPIAVSARHIHLTQEHVEALFGPGHTLTVKKPLTQPGQFAAEERVTLIGPKRSIPKVRVLGPIRGKTQVEIARTDEFTLGIDAPVRRSGDLDNTPGITLEGPYGRVTLKQGVICAWRHIHMTPEDADRFGVEHRDIVDVAVDTQGRDLTFGDVMVRVSPKYALEMHIDTDEANAAEIARDTAGVLLITNRQGHLLSKRSRR